MNLLRAAPLVALFAFTANAGCRDADANPTRPSFAVTSDTTPPGGCNDRVCNFRTSGNSASVSWSTVAGGVSSDTGGGGGGGTTQFGFVSVSNGGNQQTFLSYSVSECSPSFCNQIAGGFGVISDDDFTFQGPRYRLNTNTANNPNFFTFAGPVGIVTVEWTTNGLFSRSSTGTQRVSSPGFSMQEAGQSSDQSARASGNVVGFSIGSSNSGFTSSNHDVRISITRPN